MWPLYRRRFTNRFGCSAGNLLMSFNEWPLYTGCGQINYLTLQLASSPLFSVRRFLTNSWHAVGTVLTYPILETTVCKQWCAKLPRVSSGSWLSLRLLPFPCANIGGFARRVVAPVQPPVVAFSIVGCGMASTIDTIVKVNGYFKNYSV